MDRASTANDDRAGISRKASPIRSAGCLVVINSTAASDGDRADVCAKKTARTGGVAAGQGDIIKGGKATGVGNHQLTGGSESYGALSTAGDEVVIFHRSGEAAAGR